MVKDPKTGLMFGSIIEKTLVTDASFYTNKKIKVRTRNTSGDVAFGLKKFADKLRTAYSTKGYEPTTKDDFGLLIDVNVKYSGQIQTNMATEYGFLGAIGGGLAGASKTGGTFGTAAGAAAGATVGTILGSFITEDTYIIIVRVTFAVIKKYKKSKKKITFSRSQKLKNMDDPDEEDKVYKQSFKKAYSTYIAVFAGGDNTPQSKIADQVSQRIIRIVSDFI
jgi:predicted lipid-binding transport protein (Tim44 family)